MLACGIKLVVILDPIGVYNVQLGSIILRLGHYSTSQDKFSFLRRSTLVT